MSTQKQLAKVVRIDWQTHQNYKGRYHWYETQDGKKFYRVDFRPSKCPSYVKVYLVKKLNVIKANQWAYVLYEVPKLHLMDLKNKDWWRNPGKQREIVYEVKK